MYTMYLNQWDYDYAEPEDHSAERDAMEREGLDPDNPEHQKEFNRICEENRAESLISRWEVQL